MAKQSINKAQAQLLATDFLDSLGRDADAFQPDETLTELIMLAGEFVIAAQNNLNKGGHVSSGKLNDSLKVLNPYENISKIVVDVEALFYYQFLNKGVKGIKSGNGQYAFKTSYPSKDMVNAITEWLKKAKSSTTNINKSISRLEKKNRTLAQYQKAYAVARSIKMLGIKKTSFFDNAVKDIQQIAKGELAKSFKVDIINTIPKNLNDVDSNQQ